MMPEIEDCFETEQDKIWHCGNHVPLQTQPDLFHLEECHITGKSAALGFLALHFWRDVARSDSVRKQ
ncbi:hypothetical protein HGO38_05035 [Rhizobium sp. CG5]|uniref:hypothetical protein n=1 Tax=Rhizobium sp. CG5 TaxID=2726076 RepID=UPI00203436EF|nr:hypothetical protein [Rhizobium sp. CG5]MCM2472842.1 hypothetical protein [Rhizobium sp. CG5]